MEERYEQTYTDEQLAIKRWGEEEFNARFRNACMREKRKQERRELSQYYQKLGIPVIPVIPAVAA